MCLWIGFAFITALSTTLISAIMKEHLKNQETIEYATTIRLNILLASILLVFFIDPRIPQAIILLIYLGSWLNVFGYWFFSKSIKHMDLSLSSPFLNFEVIFILLFSYLFLNEDLPWLSIIGIFVVLLGVYILESKGSVKEMLHSIIHEKYHIIAITSTLLYGAMKVLSRYLLAYKELDVLTFIFYNNLFVGVNFLILISFVEKDNIVDILSKKIYYNKNINKLTILTFTQLASEFIAFALAPAAALVTVIKMSYTLFNEYFAYTIYKEKITIKRLLGAIIIFFGILLAVLAK